MSRNAFAAFACLILMPLSAFGQSRPGTTPHTSPAAARKSAPAAVAEELRLLRETLLQQQQQITDLQRQMAERDRQWSDAQRQWQKVVDDMRAQVASETAAGTAAAARDQQISSEVQSGLAKLEAATASTIKTNGDQEKRITELTATSGRFRFSGDVRLRQENVFQNWSGCAAPKCDPRIRELVRLRLGVESRLNSDFSAGLFVASGAVTNPTTTNETLANAFERKTVAWDRGYIVYNPQRWKWLSLVGGKFAPTWQKTTQTFDPDLNPEGFSEKVSFDLAHAGVLKNVSLTAVQLMFHEVSRGPDSYASGGQVSARLKAGRWTATPSYMFLDWHRPDVLLNEPASTNGGTAVGPLAPNGMTNSTYKDAAGVLHFTGGFFYSDFILDNSIRTPWARFPLRFVGEYEVNLGAAAANRNRHLYQAIGEIGRAQEKHDLLLGYGWNRQEQDSVIASFVESEQRAPTNVLQHRFYFQYNVEKNVSFAPSFWFGRTLDSSLPNSLLTSGVTAGDHEPYMKHIEFDLIYKF